MVDTIRFGKPMLVEGVSFNQLQIAAYHLDGTEQNGQEAFAIVGTRMGKPEVDFDKDDRPDIVVCRQTIRQGLREKMECSVVVSSIKVTERKRIKLSNLRFGDVKHIKLEEVGHGDIDNDGDIDIAARVTGGAIYVWHQK